MSAVSDREQRILGIIETARSKRARFRDERITMAHGAGGKATQTLIEGLLAPALANPALDELADAGTVSVDGTALALTTDSFVVKPLRFPGGSIGELAVNGTVNDLAMAGARPVALSLSLILEEGLDSGTLRDAYSINGMPVHVFINKDGIVKKIEIGELSKAEMIADVKSLL